MAWSEAQNQRVLTYLRMLDPKKSVTMVKVFPAKAISKREEITVIVQTILNNGDHYEYRMSRKGTIFYRDRVGYKYAHQRSVSNADE